MDLQFAVIGACLLVGAIIALLRMDPRIGGAVAIVFIAYVIYRLRRR